MHTLSSLKLRLLRRTVARSVFVAIVFAIPASSAFGGDLLGFYSLAMSNDPQLASARYDNLASQESLVQAKGGLKPHVDLSFDYGYTRQEIRSSDNRVYESGTTNYGTYQYALTVTQPVFNYQSILTLDQARATISLSDMETEKARQDLILRVSESYLNVLLAQEKVSVAKSQVSAVELHHTIAKARTDRGAAPITDLYDTEARLASVKADLIAAQSLLDDSFQALREIVGTDDVQVKRLKEDFPLAYLSPDNGAIWVAEARKKNPDILALKYKSEVAGKEVERQNAGHYPTLDLQGDYIVKDTQGTLFGGGSNTATYDFLVKFSLPIYAGGSTTSKTRESGNIHQSVLKALDRQTRATERLTINAFNEVRNAINRVQAMKKSVDAQKKVVEAKEEGFKSGLYISIAVLDAMQDLYKYKLEHSQARNDYILNLVRVSRSVGNLGEEQLRQINGWLE